MKLHIYENAPVAGWLGYVEAEGWVLFFAGNGDCMKVVV